MRLPYPASIKIVLVPCTGKVDVLHMLRAFEKGADGVCIIGCMEGECQYKSGNFRARKRVEQVAKILDTIGLDGRRVRMFNLSSGDGPIFARYATEMHEAVLALGPNPLKLKKPEAA